MATQKRQSEGGIPDSLVLGVLGFLLGITVLVWTATGVSGLLAHGRWPTDAHFTRTPLAMRHLLGRPHDVAGAWPDCPADSLPGSGLFWGVFISQLMVLFVLTVFLMGVFTRYRLVRARRRAGADDDDVPATERLLRRGRGPRPMPGPRGRRAVAVPAAAGAGLPAAPEPDHPAPDGASAPVAAGHGDAGDSAAHSAALSDAMPTGPATNRAPAVTDPLSHGELTRTYVLFTGTTPRADKAERSVRPALLNAAGPALVTTADPDTYHRTVGNRAKLGPILVYDPAHLIDVPGRLRWAPHAGCEDPATATARARSLLAPVRPAGAADSSMFAAAETLLRCWLHAAAVDGLPFRQVHRWAAGGAAGGEAVRILRTAHRAASGWSGELESVLHAHPDRRDTARALIHRALECLDSVHIRDACNPGRNGALDLESFLSERGTIYVVGEAIEDPRARPGAMPLLTALVSCVVEHGRRMAERSSSGRLDPPLTLVLDDIATVAPLPELPSLLALGTGSGLPTLAVFRSPEQARARWHSALWQQADLRLTLGDPAGPLVDEVPDTVHLG